MKKGITTIENYVTFLQNAPVSIAKPLISLSKSLQTFAQPFIQKSLAVVHGDIKLDNMVFDDNVIKLIDWGFGRQLSSISDNTKEMDATPFYASPVQYMFVYGKDNGFTKWQGLSENKNIKLNRENINNLLKFYQKFMNPPVDVLSDNAPTALKSTNSKLPQPSKTITTSTMKKEGSLINIVDVFKKVREEKEKKNSKEPDIRYKTLVSWSQAIFDNQDIEYKVRMIDRYALAVAITEIYFDLFSDYIVPDYMKAEFDRSKLLIARTVYELLDIDKISQTGALPEDESKHGSSDVFNTIHLKGGRRKLAAVNRPKRKTAPKKST